MGSRARTNLEAENDVKEALRQLEIAALNFAYRLLKDDTVRKEYIAKTSAFSEEMLAAYRAGNISAGQAAEAANQMRNEIMEAARGKSSDIGRAKAVALKSKGLDLADLAEKYAQKKFNQPMEALLPAQRDEVFLEIVRASGRANPKVNARAARLGSAARGLWVLTVVIAAYNVGTAEYKGHALGREAAGAGGGFAGGAAGGAVAGVWFGPVGVGVGVVIGGVLGAITADQAYIEVAGPREEAVRKFLPAFTHMFHVDEDAMAQAMIAQLGINLDAVLDVFKELDRSYTSDVDDVALLYVEGVQRSGRTPIVQGLKLNMELRAFLVDSLEAGWTTDRERRAITYLQGLEKPS